ARNAAVEWRLDPAAARRAEPIRSPVWLPGRWSFRGLAVAAAIEAAIVLGVAYGLWGHAGHVAAHFAPAGHVEADRQASGVDQATLDRVQSASSPAASTSHD